jgi:nitrate reductase delta subunit
MRLLSGVRDRSRTPAIHDRLVRQSASLLLAYPDDGPAGFAARLDTVDELRRHLSGRAADLLARTVAALRGRKPIAAATDYVETFDLRRRATMYLTYWTAGDTRNRGRDMLAFATNPCLWAALSAAASCRITCTPAAGSLVPHAPAGSARRRLR